MFLIEQLDIMLVVLFGVRRVQPILPGEECSKSERKSNHGKPPGVFSYRNTTTVIDVYKLSGEEVLS